MTIAVFFAKNGLCHLGPSCQNDSKEVGVTERPDGVTSSKV